MHFTILHTEASLGWGGQEIRIVQESLGLIKRGHRAIIAAPEQSAIFKRAQENGIEVFPASYKKKNPRSVVDLLSLISSERVDIVSTHSSSDSWISTIAAKLSRSKPVIVRTRHLSTPISKSVLSRFIYTMMPDAVMTTGEAIKQQMISDNGFRASKIISVPTGIDLEQFDPKRVKPALQPNAFSIGMVGVLRSWKGHKFLIKAAPIILEAVPNATFFLVGDGPQFRNLREMVQRYSLEKKVLMLGHRDDVPELLASFDIIAHPSYANEGVPQSVLQAMAMEKPVVASNAGAISEVVIDKFTGFLVEPKNPKQLAERIIELHRNPKIAAELSKNGRELVERTYSYSTMLDKVESLYSNLLKMKQRHERTSPSKRI